MHLVLKVNGMKVFLVEIKRKLWGWYTRRKRDHMWCVGGRMKEVWPGEFVWASGILCNQEGFWKKKAEEESGSLKICTSGPVCTAQLSSPLSYLPVCTFWVIKEKKRKEADYIFIHQCRCLSLLYYTLCPSWQNSQIV